MPQQGAPGISHFHVSSLVSPARSDTSDTASLADVLEHSKKAYRNIHLVARNSDKKELSAIMP